jgi:hypothetical protein
MVLISSIISLKITFIKNNFKDQQKKMEENMKEEPIIVLKQQIKNIPKNWDTKRLISLLKSKKIQYKKAFKVN